VFTIFREWTW